MAAIDQVHNLSETDLASLIAEAMAISVERGRDQWEANFRALEGRLGSDADEAKLWLSEWSAAPTPTNT